MSTQKGFRFFQTTTRRTAIKTPFQTRQNVFRRTQTTSTAAPVEPSPPQSLLMRLWTSEVGVKTVHFWAPVMKWGVVIAGASDFFRPAEKLSLTQNLALVATGSIWTRWCFVIRPQNILLAAVNFCLFIVGTVQVSRILIWRSSQAGSTEEALKDMGKEVKGQALAVKSDAKKELA